MSHDMPADSPRCPVCARPPAPGDWTCPSCGTAHHDPCRLWAGGCALPGCPACAAPPLPPGATAAILRSHRSALNGLGRSFALVCMACLFLVLQSPWGFDVGGPPGGVPTFDGLVEGSDDLTFVVLLLSAGILWFLVSLVRLALVRRTLGGDLLSAVEANPGRDLLLRPHLDLGLHERSLANHTADSQILAPFVVLFVILATVMILSGDHDARLVVALVVLGVCGPGLYLAGRMGESTVANHVAVNRLEAAGKGTGEG